MSATYKNNIEEFNQRIRREIEIKKEYITLIEKLEAIYERSGIEKRENNG